MISLTRLSIANPNNTVTCLSRQEARFAVHFFGQFRLLHNEQPVDDRSWRHNKAKNLLKWFLLNPGHSYTTDHLIELFWAGSSKEMAMRGLHVAIHELRHLLEPDLLPRQESTFLRRSKNNAYSFELEQTWWMDIHEVQRNYIQARQLDSDGRHEQSLPFYRAVVEYCEPGFLPENAYEDVFNPYRRQYEYLYTQVMERLIHLYLQRSMIQEALTYAHQILHLDPLSEVAFHAIIKSDIQQRNMAGALARLHSFSHLLRKELGMEPGDDLRKLQRLIIENM
jgi:DNA-binding SARP family transcriptional activator